jgi:hypothetical protein
MFFLHLCLFSDGSFYGEIVLSHSREDNREYKYNSLFLNREKDYREYLNTTEIFTICGDTLISVYLDLSQDTFMTYVQIKDNLFMKSHHSGKFIRMKYNTSIGNIEQFNRKEGQDTILTRQASEYISYSPSGNTEHVSFIDTSVIYDQFKYEFLFAKVFTEHGLLLRNRETYLPKNLTKYSKMESIKSQVFSCKVEKEGLGYEN